MTAKSSVEWLQAVTCTRGVTEKQRAFRTTSATILFPDLAERNTGSPGGLQFQRVTMKLFPSASAPCLIEQTYQCPFVEVSHIRTLSATPQNRPFGANDYVAL
ncbi:hypothetical protein PO909_016720 [Leuciscus waleckii]